MNNARPIRSRVARAVLWSGANTVFTRLANIVITAVVVRMVTPDEFGAFSVALAVFTVVNVFAEVGMSQVLARADTRIDRFGPTVMSLSLLLGFGLGAVTLVTAAPIARLTGQPGAADALRVLSLCVLLAGVTTVPSGLLMRYFRQDAVFVANIASFVPSSAVLIVLASNGSGALAFAWSRVVGQVFASVAMFVLSRGWYRPALEPAVALEVMRFGVPLAGANLLKVVLLNADYLFISRMLGATALGVYTLAFNVGSWASSVLAGMVWGVAMPAYSQAARDPAELRMAIRHSTHLVGIVGFPVAAVTIALAEPIVAVLYGQRWLDSAPVLAVLGAYGSLFVLCQLLQNLLVALGLTGRNLLVQVVWLGLLIPAMLIGVKLDGTTGAAWAHIMVTLLVLPTTLWCLHRAVPGVARLTAQGLAEPLAFAVLAGVTAYLTALPFGHPLSRLLVGGVSSVVAYLLVALPSLAPYAPGRVRQRLDPVLQVYQRAHLTHVLVPHWHAALPARVGTPNEDGEQDRSHQ